MTLVPYLFLLLSLCHHICCRSDDTRSLSLPPLVSVSTYLLCVRCQLFPISTSSSLCVRISIVRQMTLVPYLYLLQSLCPHICCASDDTSSLSLPPLVSVSAHLLCVRWHCGRLINDQAAIDIRVVCPKFRNPPLTWKFESWNNFKTDSLFTIVVKLFFTCKNLYS